jgi:flagellar protein FlbD
MIKLTRLDGNAFILNADLIRYVEQRPDTFVTLVSGERIVVGESMDRVVELAIDYQQRKAMLPAMTTAALIPSSLVPSSISTSHSE